MPTPEKLHETAALIRTAVQSWTATPIWLAAKDAVRPARADLNAVAPQPSISLGHILWMCDEIDRFIDEGDHDKANRCIGFAQGALWIIGVTSIEESRRVNMREGSLGMHGPIVVCSKCDCSYEESYVKVQSNGSVVCVDCLPNATDPEYIHVTVLRAALDYDPDAEISAERLLKEIKEMVLKENADD